ncbi:hypothetical protein HOLleu_34683 [Holothuria leucospilota]|uniref:Uncharacterized protein n=1 Tax=Holothuria leucospilota TaxID=206669 RepID=A0A9Q0YQE8_HOLLE|nr:hypothetical protein HOLleu_34683 [Holothuria leucospilota]
MNDAQRTPYQKLKHLRCRHALRRQPAGQASYITDSVSSDEMYLSLSASENSKVWLVEFVIFVRAVLSFP